MKMQKHEIAEKDQLLDSSNKVVAQLVEDSERDMATIYNLNDQIKKLKAQLEQEKETHLSVKRKLYDDF
jgi:hypothetical protein